MALRSGQPPIQVVLIKEIRLNIYIYLFLLFGLLFGLSTFSYMHLFSEGPHKVDTPEGGSTLGGRVLWAMVCTFLWPIMVLTGLNSARILAKRKRQTIAANP
jgi:hypothetical protein